MHTKRLNSTGTWYYRVRKMVSGYHNSELLNFFGIKETRKYIRICLRCGSDNIHQEKNSIECKECGKVISIKHS